MKWLLILGATVLLSLSSVAQSKVVDSLYQRLNKVRTDSGRASILYNLSYYYQNSKPDSALLLGQQAYNLLKKHNSLEGESAALGTMAGAFSTLDNYPKAIEYYIEELKIEEKRGIPENISARVNNMSAVYNSERDVNKALYYILKADSIVKQNNLTTIGIVHQFKHWGYLRKSKST